MGLISRLLAPAAPAAGPAPHDDYWYRPVGGAYSATGLRVDPDVALKLSAVWACVRVIAESIATLPFVVYRRRPNDGKERAADHPLFDLLHDQPNAEQTAIEWRQQLTTFALLRGNAYAEIVAGPRGFVDQLVPLNPDWLTVPSKPGEAYVYREPLKAARALAREDVFRLRGLTLDGMRGVSVIEYARESLGIGLAAEQYAGRVFSQDARPRGVLEHPGRLSKDGAERLAKSWNEAYAGLANAHRVAVLEEGLKFSTMSVSPNDAQMLASRAFSVEDVCRWFGVPPHMVGSTAKVTSWGTGIEQLSTGFVVFTLLPWLRRWEQAVQRDLILRKDVFFAEHIVDGLVRGDLKTRYECYSIGRQNGWLSANDVRRFENMNPIPDGDRYLEPLNMQPVGQDAPSRRRPPAEEEDDDDDEQASANPADWQAAIAALAGERRNGHADDHPGG